MINLLNVLSYKEKITQMKEQPQSFVHELSFGIVKGYFGLLFVVLGLLSAGSLWAGFFQGILFFKIVFFLFFVSLIASIVVFQTLRRISKHASTAFVSEIRSKIQPQDRIIDVDSQNTPQA